VARAVRGATGWNYKTTRIGGDCWNRIVEDELLVAGGRIYQGVTMDKDRVKGAAHQAKGAVKEKAGRATGDKKMQGEGKGEKAAGKLENTVGRVKDSLRGK
jgi:uncharacterized protein YjbJ (UPF0337 family)